MSTIPITLTSGQHAVLLDPYGQLQAVGLTGAEGTDARVNLTWYLWRQAVLGTPRIALARGSALGWHFTRQAVGSTFQGTVEGCDVQVTVGIDALGPSWQIEVTNNSSQTVDGVSFELDCTDLRQSGYSSTIPHCAGWELPLANLRPDDLFTLSYPVQGSMQWVDLFRSIDGIYFGVHDPLPLYKQLTIAQGEDGTTIGWHFSDLALPPGASLTLPKVYVIRHTGDWHRGADLYRAWARERYPAPATPAWCLSKPSWAWVGLRGQGEAVPWHHTSDLPTVSAQAAACGVDLLQLTAYTAGGHDTLYPDYRPDESLGGEAGLREAVRAIHAAGRKMTIYTNGRLVDPAASLIASEREDWAVRPAPGAPPLRETYGQVTFDVMCPGAAGWRELFIRRLAYLVEAYDIDGIYIDQVSGAVSEPCYAPGHDHSAPNTAWSFYQQLLGDLRRTLNRIKPGVILATEGVNDLFARYFDIQQAHQDWPITPGDKTHHLDNLYRYTFPGHILNSGCITRGETGLHYLKVAHLAGSGCDIGIAEWEGLPDEFCQAMHFVTGWHKEWTHILQHAPCEVASMTEGVQANVFAPADGRTLIVQVVWMPVDTAQAQPNRLSLELEWPAGCNNCNIEVQTPAGAQAADWRHDHSVLKIDTAFSELAGIAISGG